ncbi:hypothetical protein [Pseudanabaena sp. 'Roaring Creek']|uniref:hypothetical protein n=1 Tax=Pseudanabaena sp. 'Roaring Creek' TaxID=1681830 RepID=UPI0006D7E378|nr:hypothetical protein [Pseudanabaena sp. 'Roaring Creek']
MAGRVSVYFEAADNVFALVSVDKNKYSGDVLAAVGGESTKPANATVFTLSEKAAKRSGEVRLLKVGVKKGKQRRQVNLICSQTKAATVAKDLEGKKMTIGLGQGTDWDIVSVT